jgi:4,4'-diaponeurosporenoate glycosyltransferase
MTLGFDVAGVTHTPWELGFFGIGWTIGWLLLWRPRPLGVTPDHHRSSVAVIVPARDEEHSLPELLGSLLAQATTDDEIVVVDDHSTDDTAAVASGLGAHVLTPPELPAGWLGKPHACHHGAAATAAPVLVFVDADVQPGPSLLADVAAAVEATPEQVVSVQPWHRMDTTAEQASVLCNITALMGSGGFTVLGRRVHTDVAFGPVLALRRDLYERVGGHAAPSIRAMHTEDIGLARAVGRSSLYTGAPATTFRMYPGGLGDLVRGWTRSIATGARATHWWVALAILGWVWSLAGGWIAAPIVYPLSALQVWVLGRRAGSIRPLTAILYPVVVVVFVVIFLRSLWMIVARRKVRWKGRDVAART